MQHPFIQSNSGDKRLHDSIDDPAIYCESNDTASNADYGQFSHYSPAPPPSGDCAAAAAFDAADIAANAVSELSTLPPPPPPSNGFVEEPHQPSSPTGLLRKIYPENTVDSA